MRDKDGEDSQQLDYRNLLARYMCHIIQHEGVSFIHHGPYPRDIELGDDEKAILDEIEAEIKILGIPPKTASPS